MKNKLYVIGNGFDLFHGLRTSYWNFKEYLQVKDVDLLDNIEKYLWSEDLWSNFETALENLVAENIVDDCLDYLPSYAADDWSDSGHHDYQYEVGRRIESLTSELKNRFKEWIETISPIRDNNDIRCSIDKDSLFLTFNYTDTLESLYLVNKKDILHIHGNINDVDSKIILGHGRNPSTMDHLDGEGNENSDIRVIEANRTINGYYDENYKNTKQILAENRSFFEKLNSVEHVIVLGHSMADVDKDYFSVISKNVDLNAAKWVVSFHDKNEIESKSKFMEALGVKPGNITFLRIAEIDSDQLSLF